MARGSVVGKRTRRTRGADLTIAQLMRVFDEHVPFATCKPKTLFAYEAGRKWPIIKAHLGILRALLDEGHGRVPKLVSLTEGMRSWLKSQDLAWTVTETETCSFRLPKMFQQLLDRKRRPGRAPARYEVVQVLIDRVHLSDDDDAMMMAAT